MAVNIPPAAEKLRRLMNLGQFIQSHALSFFHPERPGSASGLGHAASPAQRIWPDCSQCRPRAEPWDAWLAPIRPGNGIEILGGKKIHPAWAVPGGVRVAHCPTKGAHASGPGFRKPTPRAKLLWTYSRKPSNPTQTRDPDLRQFPIAVYGSGRCRRHIGSITVAQSLRFVDSSGSIIADPA